MHSVDPVAVGSRSGYDSFSIALEGFQGVSDVCSCVLPLFNSGLAGESGAVVEDELVGIVGLEQTRNRLVYLENELV